MHISKYNKAKWNWNLSSLISNSETLSITSPTYSNLQHMGFPSSYPSSYWPGLKLLNFGEHMRIGVSMLYRHKLMDKSWTTLIKTKMTYSKEWVGTFPIKNYRLSNVHIQMRQITISSSLRRGGKKSQQSERYLIASSWDRNPDWFGISWRL